MSLKIRVSSQSMTIFANMFIVLALFQSSWLLDNQTLNLNVHTGAVVTGMGYYTVMWGQIREDEPCKCDNVERIESSDEKVTLLQEENEVWDLIKAVEQLNGKFLI